MNAYLNIPHYRPFNLLIRKVARNTDFCAGVHSRKKNPKTHLPARQYTIAVPSTAAISFAAAAPVADRFRWALLMLRFTQPCVGRQEAGP